MILLLCFLFYIPALWHHYTIDDLAVLDKTERENIPKPKNKLKYLWMIFSGQGVWGEKNFSFHAMPIIIHFIVCWLIYFAFGRIGTAYIAAILFALHPCGTEVSVWWSGKFYGITAIVALLAWWLPMVAPAIYFLAYLSPQMFCVNGLFAPLVFLLLPNWWSALALLCPILIYRYRKGLFSPDKNAKMVAYKDNKESRVISPRKLIVFLKFYGYYLVNNIFAIHYSFYQSYMDDFIDTKEGIKKSYKLDVFFWAGCAGLVLLFAGLCLKPYNLAVLGLFWATVNIAMWCNFINLGQQYITNRYAYLANVGLCLMLASILIRYPIAAGVFIGWYARQLIYAIRNYESVFWQFFYQISDERKFYFSWILWGNLMYHRGAFVSAKHAYEEALKLRPNNFKCLFNLSSAYLAKGQVGTAIKYFELARKADVYGQERRAEEEIIKRMKLINYVIEQKGNVKLTTNDIPVVA